MLLTGGAGFIGSHTARLLVDSGYYVTILDNFENSPSGTSDSSTILSKECETVKGSILARRLLEELCVEADAVIHLAALVGAYRSMYEVDRYIEVNTRGTANLLDVLINCKNSVRKLIIGSSMMVYGEGTYKCSKCGSLQYPELRDPMNLKKGKWDHTCPTCNGMLEPQPTSESRPARPGSIYATSKLQQEQIGLLVAKTYEIPTTVLRYFNVYGSGQSLSNPYTGVCAVFSSRILNGKPPVLFEDGLMLRDFVHVKDVARANLMALESQRSDYQVLNIGSGVSTSIVDLARSLIEIYGSKVEPEISYKYRKNDIRQCYADISKAKSVIGYRPTVDLQTGMRELANWVMDNRLYAVDQFDAAIEDLSRRKLIS